MKRYFFFILVLILIGSKSFSQEKDLFYFINKARTNSPLLADYQNQIKISTLDSLLNRASYKTQVAANLNANYAPVINGYGYDTALSNGQMVSALVGFNQRILGKGQISSQAESFKLIKDALVINKKIAVKDLDKSIISQYITAFGTEEQMVFNNKVTTLLKEEEVILKKLTKNSIYKQTDYLIFNATIKQQELTALQLKQQYQNDLALLNYLTGEKDTAEIKLKSPDLTIKPDQEQSNIFLKQFETDSLKIKNADKLIDNNYKPSLSVLGDAGYNSSFIYQGYKNFGFSVGLGLSIPIYDGNQRSLQHHKNSMALATNEGYTKNFKRQYDQQLFLLNQRISQSTETNKMLQSQLSVAEALIEANKKLLLSGDAQITEYIIALSNLISIENAITQNSVNNLQTINEINYWKSNE
ncbi:outer membrane protein TolC [Flavobacterium sp. 90]|uniref:TolC family protein n=1 Tax=unclassified Flavobacterium TaxID=196869 RepID=UPI000EB20FC0|nr:MULTISPECIES: TolC family protein [unclassified Flavobacterium]RKR04984.1 outer membrane protein TolC [Flavobacterium sp. 81]TCK56302.1 outer membrane protein TolC [Flavobacterium sp. 90]